MNLRSVFLAVLAGSLLQVAPALAAPPNDNFASAQSLFGTSTSVTGTTVDATLEPGEAPHYAGNSSVWYSWTAPEDLLLWLDTCVPGSSTEQASVQLYTGSAVNALTEVKYRADSPDCPDYGGGTSRRYNVQAGTTYAIAVVEFNHDGAFPLDLSVIPTPANDDFAAAQNLGQELDVDVDGTTVGTTTEPGEDNYLDSPDDGNSVWYRWTPPKRTRVWIDNCDSAVESTVTVYTGSALGALDQVDENYGYPEPPPCELPGYDARGRSEFLARAGATYMIRVYAPYAGAIHLRLRGIRYDSSLTQDASAKKVKKGKKVEYTIKVENLGTVPVDPDVWLITSQRNKIGKPVEGTKYVSLDATKGRCGRVTFFAANAGAICRVDIRPGETAKIVARVKPSQSLSHWVRLDYSHAGEYVYEDSRADEDGKNEAEKPANTVVKRKRKHHR